MWASPIMGSVIGVCYLSIVSSQDVADVVIVSIDEGDAACSAREQANEIDISWTALRHTAWY